MKLRKNIIYNMLCFSLGALIFGTISAYAVSSLSGINVLYSNSNSKLSSENVQDAIDELYSKVAQIKEIKKFCQLKSGTALTVGSKYECDPGDGIKRNFYVLTVRNNEVDLIMENNLSDKLGTARTMTWNDAMKYFITGAGKDIPSAWTNVMNIDLPKAQAIVDAVGNTSWIASDNGATWWCFGSKTQDYQSAPYCKSSTQGTYAWLFNHLVGCTVSGCTDDSGATASGYWTRDLISNTTYAWRVIRHGDWDFDPVSVSTRNGVRPVITVLKSNLYK